MSKRKRRTVSFVAQDQVGEPVKAKFFKKTGQKVSFAIKKIKKRVRKPVKVDFHAKKKRKG
jgi:hypothetical protein